MSPDDDTDAQNVTEADEAEQEPLPLGEEASPTAQSEATPEAPPQSWSTTQCTCQCCHVRRKLDDNTSMCVACWICAFKKQPDTVYAYGFWRTGKTKCSCDPKRMAPAVPSTGGGGRGKTNGRFVPRATNPADAGPSRGTAPRSGQPRSQQAGRQQASTATSDAPQAASTSHIPTAAAQHGSSPRTEAGSAPPQKKRSRQQTPPDEETTEQQRPTRKKQSTLTTFLQQAY